MTERSRPYRAAFIGCGRVAAHYVSILRANPVAGLEIVAIADPVEARAVAIAEAFGARVHPGARELLAGEDELDLVFVLTPSGSHHEHARAALEHGLHVISEKPITLRPEDAEELAGFAEERGLLYGVVFQNRWNPAVVAVRDAHAEGRFGDGVTATVRLRWCRTQDYYEDGWHGTWSQDGGVISQQAIHHIDALDWICGPVESVAAAATRRANRLEAEDTLVAALRFADGSLGTIEATTAARPRDVEASLSVVGTAGIAQIGGIALNEVQGWEFVERRDGDDDVFTRCSQEVPTGYGLSHGPFLEALVARLDAGRVDAPVPARDGIRAVELVHALYASVEQNRWVRLDEGARSQRLGVRDR
jgi:UDP-N-acetyl-2-amino-2-deoxyglucuronate dehydrogenase